MTLKLGKLPNNLLKKLLKRLTITDPRVLQGPGIGEDTAHISFGNKTLIVKSDPITFATDNLGWYALNVNANDIATSGAVPRWFTATVLLPEGVTEEYVEDLFGQLETAARELNVSLIGGHTEVTLGLDISTSKVGLCITDYKFNLLETVLIKLNTKDELEDRCLQIEEFRSPDYLRHYFWRNSCFKSFDHFWSQRRGCRFDVWIWWYRGNGYTSFGS